MSAGELLFLTPTGLWAITVSASAFLISGNVETTLMFLWKKILRRLKRKKYFSGLFLICYVTHICEKFHSLPWTLTESIFCGLTSFFFVTASVTLIVKYKAGVNFINVLRAQIPKVHKRLMAVFLRFRDLHVSKLLINVDEIDPRIQTVLGRVPRRLRGRLHLRFRLPHEVYVRYKVLRNSFTFTLKQIGKLSTSTTLIFLKQLNSFLWLSK